MSTSTNSRTKVTDEQISSFCKVKGGRTVKSIQTQFAVTAATVRKHVNTLTASKKLTMVGTEKTGDKGRPATLFANAEYVAQN